MAQKAPQQPNPHLIKPRAIAIKPLIPSVAGPPTPPLGNAFFPMRAGPSSSLVPNMPLFTLNENGHAMPVLPGFISPHFASAAAFMYHQRQYGKLLQFPAQFAAGSGGSIVRPYGNPQHLATPPPSPALIPKVLPASSSTQRTSTPSSTASFKSMASGFPAIPVAKAEKPSKPPVEKKVVRRRLKAKDMRLVETIYDICAERIVGRYVMAPDEMRQAVVLIDEALAKLDTVGNPSESTLQLKYYLRRARQKMHLRIHNKKFDIDSWIIQHFKDDKMSALLKSDFDSSLFLKRKRYNLSDDAEIEEDEEFNGEIPFEKSFKRRLLGDSSLAHSMDHQSTRSPFSTRLLAPFLWRDYETVSPQMKLFDSIRSRVETENGNLDSETDQVAIHPESIDFTYLRPHHLDQVNRLLCRLFWPGIDLSTDLNYPEHAIVVLYGRKVIGCAVLDLCHTHSYITYLAVDYGWQGCGIANTLMHFMTCMYRKDVLLHVQPTNWSAMKLYQKWGFKAEKYLIGFYDRYVPWKDGEGPGIWSTRGSRNAFYMRLRK